MFRSFMLATALVALAAPVLADSWVVECASNSPGPWPDSQFCNEAKMLEVSAPNLSQKMRLRLAAPTTHCSEISYIVNRLPGSSDPIAMLERLKPGEAKIIALGDGWAEEGTFITISAVGHVGGCNEGVLGSWGAVTDISAAP